MKKRLGKYSLILLALLLVWCVVPSNVNAEEVGGYGYPSEKQIKAYKEDGSWEKRQEYVKKLNQSVPSQELLYNAIQRDSGVMAYAAGDDIPDAWKGMQVTGDAKMLMVRVEFADVKFEDSKIYSEEELYGIAMGNGDSEYFPYESLNAYYKRSSYNKLNITSGKVYSCTLMKNRNEYEWSDSGEQDLIEEVLGMLDESVDFTDYDADNNGRIDGICINFAGENTGWGSTWWSHKYTFLDSSVTFDGVTPAGYVFLETYLNDICEGTRTLIHETGHLLGLPDYYSQYGEGLGTSDMMNNNTGDHNGFSKWLLGWIEESNIQKITGADGNTKVNLSPISTESPGDDKLIAVIAPEDTAIYSEYFVVQYDEYIGNQSIFEAENPAYRIFHVNAELDEEGTNFRYDNVYVYDKHLIKSVPIVEEEYGSKRHFYTEGDELTPDTNESSAFYGGNILGFTGIEIKDFKTGDNASFNVSFREKEAVDGKLEFQVVGDMPLNMAELNLISNKPLIDAESDAQAYLEDSEGNKYPLELSFESGSRKVKTSYLLITKQLKQETEYTLVIPEGMFQIDKDVYSEECRIKIKTGKFPQIEASYTYGANSVSNLFALDDKRAGFIQTKEESDEKWIVELHLFEETEEVDVITVNIPIPESYSAIMTMEALTCYDGTIAVCIKSGDPADYSSIFSFYKIDENGNVLAGPFSLSEKLEFFPAGNGIKGTTKQSDALGAPDIENEYKHEIYTIDFEKYPESCLINVNKYFSNVFAADEESYFAIQDLEDECIVCIFNNDDELIETVDLSGYIDGSICAAVKDENSLVIMSYSVSDDDEYVVSVSEFDMKGNHLGTHEIIRFGDWKSIDGWKLEKTEYGYSLSNYTSEQPYSICLIDEDFELISCMQVPDSLCDGTQLGSRCIVKWYDITTWGYRVAITEKIEGHNNDVIPEPDAPSDNTDADKDDVPGTGDTENMSMFFFAALVSGVIIACILRRYLLR